MRRFLLFAPMAACRLTPEPSDACVEFCRAVDSCGLHESWVAAGKDPIEYCEQHCALTAEDVRACIAFANQLLKDEEIRFYETERAEII